MVQQVVREVKGEQMDTPAEKKNGKKFEIQETLFKGENFFLEI